MAQLPEKKQSFLFGFYRASLQDLFWVSDLLLKIFIYSDLPIENCDFP